MKPLKIHLQYPWKFPDSPYYKYLIDSPPEGIEYLNAGKDRGVIISKRFFWFSNFLKRNIRRWTNRLNLKIPNAHLSPKGDYDLIFYGHTHRPWTEKYNGLELINPGNLAGQINKASFAIYDTKSNKLELKILE